MPHGYDLVASSVPKPDHWLIDVNIDAPRYYIAPSNDVASPTAASLGLTRYFLLYNPSDSPVTVASIDRFLNGCPYNMHGEHCAIQVPSFSRLSSLKLSCCYGRSEFLLYGMIAPHNISLDFDLSVAADSNWDVDWLKAQLGQPETRISSSSASSLSLWRIGTMTMEKVVESAYPQLYLRRGNVPVINVKASRLSDSSILGSTPLVHGASGDLPTLFGSGFGPTSLATLMNMANHDSPQEGLVETVDGFWDVALNSPTLLSRFYSALVDSNDPVPWYVSRRPLIYGHPPSITIDIVVCF